MKIFKTQPIQRPPSFKNSSPIQGLNRHPKTDSEEKLLVKMVNGLHKLFKFPLKFKFSATN